MEKPDVSKHPAFLFARKILKLPFFYARINCQVMRISAFYDVMKTKEF